MKVLEKKKSVSDISLGNRKMLVRKKVLVMEKWWRKTGGVKKVLTVEKCWWDKSEKYQRHKSWCEERVLVREKRRRGKRGGDGKEVVRETCWWEKKEEGEEEEQEEVEDVEEVEEEEAEEEEEEEGDE